MFRLRRNHWIGLLIGALLGAVAAGLGSVVGYTLELSDGLFWGAVIGSVLFGVPQFVQSGAVLTRSERPVLNAVVGFVVGILFLGLVLVSSVFLTRLFF